MVIQWTLYMPMCALGCHKITAPAKPQSALRGRQFYSVFIRKQSYCATSVLTVVVSTGRAEGSTRLMPSMKSAMDEPL